MAAILVVVVNPVIDLCHDFLERAAGVNEILDLVFHMTEEALLRGIIPAVAPAGHGLYEVGILELFDKSIACVMTSLVRVILNSA